MFTTRSGAAGGDGTSGWCSLGATAEFMVTGLLVNGVILAEHTAFTGDGMFTWEGG